jgi:hypothetical protein
VPSSQAPKSNVASSSGSTTGGTTTGGATTATTWNYLNSVATTITINSSNLNTAYLVGTKVENYLATSTNFVGADYCLVTDYSLGGLTYQLRSRIVPISFYDFTKKKNVRILRVDFPDTTNSISKCSGSLYVRNSGGTYVAEAPASSTQFAASSVCPSCTSALTSMKVRVFKKGTTLQEIPDSLISFTGLTVLLDPNANSTGSSGSCTNSYCQQSGFDCCLDNQCVNDGATKPAAASQYASLLSIAEAEKIQNPLAYLNYPQLYFICGSNVPSTTGGSSSGGGGYDSALDQLKKDYSCIQNLKSQASVSPFHDEVLSATYAASTDCLTAAGDVNEPQYYLHVMERLYVNCGCSRTILSEAIQYCPKYDYVIGSSSGGIPTRIDCYTPPVEGTPLPTQMTVSVSSRSVPHRFFDSLSGTERKITEGETNYVVAGVTNDYVQEGSTFRYFDDAFVMPDVQPFSMNAILGQMTVQLDQALPAKTVPLELDQVYEIRTTSGYFTPCPMCNKDSWMNAFSAYPSTMNGMGLQATGHTVSRDAVSTNASLGNYEDTIFGRACWLPPTMIPFTHAASGTVQGQRMDRLEAQAALFSNGYQRDWFGFNKGALIGSFDGVTWFAIGNGRIVRSTSKKLFLAINAPFGDLATANMHVVNITLYNGTNKAAQLDYDPNLAANDPSQNMGGSCQAYHMCSTDTDCVTKLGWEYMCADVKDVKSNWPQFDTDANEVANSNVNTTIDQILFQKKFPTGSTKRCVYRGAGAPCKIDPTTVADLNQRKLMSCAPNFYCANLATAGKFNDRVSRYASALEDLPVANNHFFGKDANVLGRPMNYLSSAGSSIPGTVATSLQANIGAATGLCQPGKSLASSNPNVQHQSQDAGLRTDFISQIGGCNSTNFTDTRYSSCPVINSTTGDYEMFESTFSLVGYNGRARSQNSCGLDSLETSANLASPADTLLNFSPFKAVEAKTLSSAVVTNPTFARDACLRRAGQVCHTNLDCGPSRLHAEQVDYFPLSYFGSQAEKNYYSESLICGQTDPVPYSTDVNFKTYDMSQNRCCREVGAYLTTYTSNVPTTVNPGSVSGDITNYDPASAGLLLSLSAANRVPGKVPNAAGRYSRFATVESLGTASRPYLSAYQNRSAAGVLDVSIEGVADAEQWKTLNEANSETCCGGGWVRKFSDGSNNWAIRDRVSLDVTNFKCINARSVLLTRPSEVASEYTSGDPTSLVSLDYGDYCKDGTNTKGSCAQYSIADSLADTYPSADAFKQAKINTVNPLYTGTYLETYFNPRSADGNSSVFIDYNNAGSRQNIYIKIPSYITSVLAPVQMITSTGNAKTCGAADLSDLTSPGDSTTANCAAGNCCYDYNSVTRTMKLFANNVAIFANQQVGAAFSATVAGSATISRNKPGTNSYYLRRLGQLELSGIPQISHEELYCSDNSAKVVPGIFSSAISDKVLFQAGAFAYNNGGHFYTNFHGLENEPVFSANDFKCCTPLGKTADGMNKCCTGYGLQQGTTNKYTCMLPVGTDLMVYFNRLVSNEGVGTDKPGGGLVETDFDATTGEPLLNSTVNQKIADLGIAFCESGKVRQGGAFGAFEPEPQGSDTDLSSRIYGIVDSTRDNGVLSNAGSTVTVGYTAFTDGFRWNHHLYCDY